MSTPDDDLDPTGMRDLLRSLPDPGPMPEDLVARIQSSLAELSLADVEGDEGVAAFASAGDVSRGTSSAGSPSWFTRNGSKLAVAAVVLVGGGALVGSLPGLVAGSSDDSASSSAAGGSAESGGDAAREAPLTDTDSLEQGYAVGPVVVTMSGRTYTAGGLAGELGGELGSGASAPLKPLTAESPGIGPIGTEIGVRSCLEALGVPTDARAEVDLALVDGAPAAVVVMTREGGRTAYAVGRSCTVGNPAIITGPIQLP